MQKTDYHVCHISIISFQYKKPSVIIDMEKSLQEEFKKMKASRDGDVDCTPS